METINDSPEYVDSNEYTYHTSEIEKSKLVDFLISNEIIHYFLIQF